LVLLKLQPTTVVQAAIFALIQEGVLECWNNRHTFAKPESAPKYDNKSNMGQANFERLGN
jgi:hypothetical protein